MLRIVYKILNVCIHLSIFHVQFGEMLLNSSSTDMEGAFGVWLGIRGAMLI